MWFSAAALVCSLPLLAFAAPVAENRPRAQYDAIIVGGGPAGLSALSGLARVRRKVLMIDSGVYRNGKTRHMHDVIGNDGLQPAYHRWLARQQISHYGSVNMTNGTVSKIQPEQNNTYFTVTGKYPAEHPGDKNFSFTARKIVLATGLRDLIPGTPGLAENWANGIFWCDWCDGYEHADQRIGVLGNLTSVPSTVLESLTLFKNMVAFVNGTDTPANREATEKSSPRWQEYLKLHNIKVENRTIAAIERLRDGSDPTADPSLPTHPEHDLFRVHFTDGESTTRDAFIANFKSEQYSRLGKDLGVRMCGDKICADSAKGLVTSVPGVYAVGDCNSDNVTNIPHALFSGKRTAVYLHVQLERENAAAELAALNGTAANAKRSVHEEARSLWDYINGDVDDVLYAAGSFESFESFEQ